MCERLSVLRKALAHWAERFDPALVSLADASSVVEQAAAIEATAATIKALAAARSAEGRAWRGEGHRSAAEALARRVGMSTQAARSTLETGRRLCSQPEVREAASTGRLSPAQTQMVSEATGSDPSSGGHLLDLARSASLACLAEACREAKAASHRDLEARRRAIQARRSLRHWTDTEGVWHLRAEGNPEDGAQVMAALAPLADRRHREGRAQGTQEPLSAHSFDALVDLARSSTGPGPHGQKAQRGSPVKLLVRVDLEAFLRGAPRDGETCELVGYGPIAMSAVRDLLALGSPFVAAILTRAKALTGVAHLGRRPSASQQSALEWLYPSCAAAGCPAQGQLEVDHRLEWAKCHYTMYELLDLLCAHHHGLKTTKGWALVEGRGKRAFVPPSDPRHPSRRSGGEGGPAP